MTKSKLTNNRFSQSIKLFLLLGSRRLGVGKIFALVAKRHFAVVKSPSPCSIGNSLK